MKFRKLLGGGLLAAVLALGGVAGLATRSESEAVNAETKTYYYRGDDTSKVTTAWGDGNDTYSIKNDGTPVTWTFKKSENFKFTADKSSWADELNCSFASEAFYAGNFGGGGTSNIYTQGMSGDFQVTFKLVDTTLYFGINLYYTGSDSSKASWGSIYTDKPFSMDGTSQRLTFAAGEKFKLVRGAGDYANELGFSSLKENYYKVFTTDNDGNFVAVTDVTLDLNLSRVDNAWKVVATSSSAQSNTLYVLDKYHDRLTDNPKAYYYVETSTGKAENNWPGSDMSVEVGNIYKIEIWDIFSTVIFDTTEGAYQSIDYTIAGKNGKCLILDHSETDGKWSSNTWVSLEVAKYIDTYMHFVDSPEVPRGTEGEGKCASEGWYVAARNAYQASSFAQYREELCTLTYVVERLEDWAKANSATFTPEDGFVPSQRITPLFGTMDNSTPIMLVVIISVVSLTAVGGYIFLKRRKED